MRKLKQDHINQLINFPETGHGYHIVNLEMEDGYFILNVVILNCEYIKDPKQTIDPQKIKKIINHE